MNKDHIARLREEQDKAIHETDEKIQQWEKFKSDYEAVAKKLSTLPDSLTQDTLVQFGPLAFMPGQLVHTNEVLVLLGDNWFVERSAKQAIDIIKRRIKQIDHQLKDLHEQKKLLMPRVAFTSELQDMAEERGGLKEIVEEYDEEKEKKWKEEHRARVREYKKRLREESQKDCPDTVSSDSSKGPQPTDEELWVRLDELEKTETERRELERMSDSDDPEFTVDAGDIKKITWSDENETHVRKTGVDKTSVRDSDDTSGSSGDSDTTSGGYSSDEEGTASDRTRILRKIIFTHSKTHQQSEDRSADGSGEGDADKPKITSPRDIYSLVASPTTPRSILKNKLTTTTAAASTKASSTGASTKASSTGTSTKASSAASTEEEEHTKPSDISSNTPKPFSGIVVENPASAASSSSSSVAMDTQPARRVSKFRAERQKQSNPR